MWRSNIGSVITELGIGNFKAFAEMQRVPIKPLTLIFGANSSGKSSIIQSLLLAHHGMETGEYDVHQTRLAGELVDLGGFANYVHKHNIAQAVTLRFETLVDDQTLYENLDGKGYLERQPFCGFSRFGLVLRLVGQEPALNGLEARIDGQPIMTFSRIASGPFRAQFVGAPHPYFVWVTKTTMELKRMRGQRSERPAEEVPEGALEQQKQGRKPRTPMELESSTLDPTEQADFNQALGEHLTGQDFSFKGFVIRDEGWGGRGEEKDKHGGLKRGLEAESLLGFYERRYSDGKEGPGQWCSAARAVIHNLSNVLRFCSMRIAEALGRISYLGSLRCVPSRHLTVHGAQDPKSLASGSAAWDVASKDPRVLSAVNRWLGSDRLRTPYRLIAKPLLDAERLRAALVERIGNTKESADTAHVGALMETFAKSPDVTELVFEDARAGIVLSHRDIGSGVSQVVPVLVNAAALRGQLVAIEQPELHLHPAQQAELGDVFIESALGERKNTFLLETHSEHLLLRIMRRIRETQAGTLPEGTTPVAGKDVSVLFVEPDGTRSIIREMPLNERGELAKAWPGGFFEEGLREVLA